MCACAELLTIPVQLQAQVAAKFEVGVTFLATIYFPLQPVTYHYSKTEPDFAKVAFLHLDICTFLAIRKKLSGDVKVHEFLGSLGLCEKIVLQQVLLESVNRVH